MESGGSPSLEGRVRGCPEVREKHAPPLAGKKRKKDQ